MRMLIFPYGHKCEPILRYAGLLDPAYEITALVSPSDWGLSGRKEVLGNKRTTLPILESFGEVAEEFDSLFIPPFEVTETMESRLVNQIVNLVPCLKHIICAARLTNVNRKRLEYTCLQVNPPCIFENLSENKPPKAYGLTKPPKKHLSLHLLNVPVVIVAGLWKNTDKFEVSLALRERFLKNGYRITQIGSRVGCELFGFHSFPGFMFRKDVDAGDKVIHFNRWISQITKNEQPDLVLITLPGAVQDLNEQFTHGSEILQHQVFKAVTPDVLVMCTFYTFDSIETLEIISTLCKHRFDTPVDVFHMSNLIIDIIESEDHPHVVTNSVYRETVSETIEKKFAVSHIPIFNALDSEGCDRMFDAIIEKAIAP